MSLYYYEVIRVDGDLRVFTKIQNEYTGTITESIRQIFYNKDGQRYFRADGNTRVIEKDIFEYISRESRIDKGLRVLRDNNL